MSKACYERFGRCDHCEEPHVLKGVHTKDGYYMCRKCGESFKSIVSNK